MVKFHKFIGSLLSKKSLSKLDKDATALPASEPAKTSDIISIRNNDAASGNSSEILPSTPNENIGLVNSIVNNVQYNAHSSPHTAISNSRGINVFQVKNTRNVHIGDNFFVETANRQNQSAEVNWTKLKQSNTIMRMMHSSIEIDNEVLEIVARHLGYEWKSFARRLGYSKGQIDAFEEDNRTLSEQIYNFISDWNRNEGNPTLGKLVSLLWRSNHKETVYHIKQAWKKREDNRCSANT